MEWWGTRAALPWGPSTDELKSKEDLFGGTGLAGVMPLWVEVGGGVLLGWVSQGVESGEEGEESQPPV